MLEPPRRTWDSIPASRRYLSRRLTTDHDRERSALRESRLRRAGDFSGSQFSTPQSSTQNQLSALSSLSESATVVRKLDMDFQDDQRIDPPDLQGSTATDAERAPERPPQRVCCRWGSTSLAYSKLDVGGATTCGRTTILSIAIVLTSSILLFAVLFFLLFPFNDSASSSPPQSPNLPNASSALWNTTADVLTSLPQSLPPSLPRPLRDIHPRAGPPAAITHENASVDGESVSASESMVVVDFVSDTSDPDAVDREAIARQFAAATGLPLSAIQIDVAAGSVVVRVTLHTRTHADADALSHDLTSRFSTSATAEQMLGLPVQSLPTIAVSSPPEAQTARMAAANASFTSSPASTSLPSIPIESPNQPPRAPPPAIPPPSLPPPLLPPLCRPPFKPPSPAPPGTPPPSFPPSSPPASPPPNPPFLPPLRPPSTPPPPLLPTPPPSSPPLSPPSLPPRTPPLRPPLKPPSEPPSPLSPPPTTPPTEPPCPNPSAPMDPPPLTPASTQNTAAKLSSGTSLPLPPRIPSTPPVRTMPTTPFAPTVPSVPSALQPPSAPAGLLARQRAFASNQTAFSAFEAETESRGFPMALLLSIAACALLVRCRMSGGPKRYTSLRTFDGNRSGGRTRVASPPGEGVKTLQTEAQCIGQRTVVYRASSAPEVEGGEKLPEDLRRQLVRGRSEPYLEKEAAAEVNENLYGGRLVSRKGQEFEASFDLLPADVAASRHSFEEFNPSSKMIERHWQQRTRACSTGDGDHSPFFKVGAHGGGGSGGGGSCRGEGSGDSEREASIKRRAQTPPATCARALQRYVCAPSQSEPRSNNLIYRSLDDLVLNAEQRRRGKRMPRPANTKTKTNANVNASANANADANASNAGSGPAAVERFLTVRVQRAWLRHNMLNVPINSERCTSEEAESSSPKAQISSHAVDPSDAPDPSSRPPILRRCSTGFTERSSMLESTAMLESKERNSSTPPIKLIPPTSLRV